MSILVTAGTVYGALDDNKLVGNRIRGIWATAFVKYLIDRFHGVYLLIPDTFNQTDEEIYRTIHSPARLTIIRHKGYDDYAKWCQKLAGQVDAAIMAAAVVNWIPQEPFKGKMPTEGYKEGDIINIPFKLAPRVIDQMKKINPKLTLIGCKMTSGAPYEETMRQAYKTLLKGRANVVLANDLSDLKKKTLVYPDGSQFSYIENWNGLYDALYDVICDEHYSTEVAVNCSQIQRLVQAQCVFDTIIARYKDRFVKRPDGEDRVFGSIAVRFNNDCYLVSPREKGTIFSSKEAVIVRSIDNKKIYTEEGQKASLNAPLLVRHLQKYPEHTAVLHLHEQLTIKSGTMKYAPPGTVRDNDRDIPAQTYNILGHGFVACLDDNNEIVYV